MMEKQTLYHGSNVVASQCGGKGGGKPDFAMAGLKDETKIDEALAAVSAIVKKALG